jgi:hypothetical protein
MRYRRSKINYSGFTKFSKNKEEQYEIESLQMQVINYLDDGTIPWVYDILNKKYRGETL